VNGTGRLYLQQIPFMLKFLAKSTNVLLGKALQKKKIFVNSSLDFLQRKRDIDKNYFDYIRLSTLELISYEIRKNKINGNTAELGVYKGKFARYINQFFPDRSLYLLDTFEGFDQRDVKKEQQHQYSTGAQDFSGTSVESVLKLMPHRDKCIIVKGYFPESAKDVNDSFAFVSLDADLYEPIYNGLKFFYPKLSKGGYIFIHDFNNDEYKGARQAVEQFCSEQQIGFVPLPDSGGSAIITK
jgi:O-methyltransferase